MSVETASLVGRRDECRRLDELLAAVRSRESRTLTLVGEPGVGKTALLDYAAAATDFRVERAVGVESEMELAFAALQQLCAPMLERLERLPAPQREALAIALGLSSGPVPDRFLVGLAVLGLLSEVAAERPLLCVIDDEQWVDRASAQTLAFVARRVSAESVGLLFATRRPGEELDGLPALEVGGLDERAARELLRSVIGSPLDAHVRDRVIAETQGNPLALQELPRGVNALELAGGFGLPVAQALAGRIEESFVRRLDLLPGVTRRLLLVAAAEPAGDPVLLLRACERLDIDAAALELGALLMIGERVTFRHPLVRSAVYRSAAVPERRDVHRALAEVTDREADPDRRAWHLAAAAAGPDEAVALELEHSAGHAQARGGFAASAAFLSRAVALTLDPGKQVERAAAAAQASLYAGAFDAALRLIGTAETGAPDASQRARLDLLRAQIAFAANRDGQAPAALLSAVGRLAPSNPWLARAGYLDALSASLFAARLAAPGGRPCDVARAVQAAQPPDGPRRTADVLLDGWAELFADGCAPATPTLQEALRDFTDRLPGPDELHLLWLVTITAPVVWDDARWETMSRRHVDVMRGTGALSELPLALHSRSVIHLFRGELAAASALIDEARVAVEATNARFTPWGSVALAAFRGREQEAAHELDAAAADAAGRGEGISLTVIAWARALLHNGRGDYHQALAAAREAIDCPTNSAPAAWGMAELVEAAARAGEPGPAAAAAERFAAIARIAGTDWALGIDARLRALLRAGAAAEEAYRESLDRLGRCPMRVELARTHLLYGEWLRRENRRVDARTQLRLAFDAFTAIGLEAFAERARRELLATGETVRKRTAETRDDLTAQERQIAELAHEGLSNPEIGARLFLSRRTVEWHLRHVFAKLDIGSRRELGGALGHHQGRRVVVPGRFPQPDRGAHWGDSRHLVGR